MISSPSPRRFRSAAPGGLAALFAAALLWAGGSFPASLAQEAIPEPGVAGENQIIDSAGLEALTAEAPAAPTADPSGVDLLSLIARGGGFMIPIGVMSFFVVALSVERLLSLRTGSVFPRPLKDRLREMAAAPERFDPREAYQVCRRRRSPAGRVIEAMLLRTGQPLGEIERVAQETAQREADALIGLVRWLNLAAAATPLMGLLGTVWGMIKAFHESTTLTPDRSRSEQLSEGIYTALVTTLAGLAVAIPAAILAQYLENRIAKLFHRIEQLAFEVAPGLVRFVGRSRLDPDGQLQPVASSNERSEPLGASTPLGKPQASRDPAKAS